MITNRLTDTDTAVNTPFLPEFIAIVRQAFQDQINQPCASFTHSLRELAYIAWIASEQSQYRHTEYRQFYTDLAATDFHISPDTLNVFLDPFLTCLHSLIENICILNYDTLVSPYHYDSAHKALQTLLGNANFKNLNGGCGDYPFLWETKHLPRLIQSLVDTPTQRLADQFDSIYKDDMLTPGASPFMAQLTQLVNQGRPLCAPDSDYAMHQQHFNDYATLSYFERWKILSELTYGVARMIELVAQTQDSPQRRDFFAHAETILGKPVNLPALQAA